MSFHSQPILNNADMMSCAKEVAQEFLSGKFREEFYPTGKEYVKAKVQNMSAIPAGANPFHHDSFSMGTDLVRGWIVMHPGFDNKESPSAMQWIYLVNTRSGQRIKINLEHSRYTLKQAARWFRKAWSSHEIELNEAEVMDAMFDGGEFSGMAHAKIYQQEFDRVLAVVASRTGVDANSLLEEYELQLHKGSEFWYP